MNFTTSKQLINNTNEFLSLKYYSKFKMNQYIINTFYGWGRKKSGQKAIKLSKKFNSKFVLLEDGFIRSLGLGVNGSPSFSIVEDDTGIYYDATTPSKLENILNTYDFNSDKKLISDAKKAINLIVENNISKYNYAKDLEVDFFEDDKERVLVIAQTAGDASLKYGMTDNLTTNEIVNIAIIENPNQKIYLKVHPDVLIGKKKSDLDIETVKNRCIIIKENVNPISLLKYFSKVYTKTSQMGFEALLVGCECICFGMPFYAGWGITIDKTTCQRRSRKRNIEEVFAAAYILYTKYYNPYRKRDSDILDTIQEIILQKKKNLNNKQYKVLALGDSHIRIFTHRLFQYFWLNKNISTVYVPGASALGIKNIHSKTQAYNKFLVALNKYNYNYIIVTLGEVDTAYTIWRNAQTNNKSIEELLKKSVENYMEFLQLLSVYARVVVISAPLSTLKDNIKCNDEISGIRKTVHISQYKRTQLTLKFNKYIRDFCSKQEDIKFIDLDMISINNKGTLVGWLQNKRNLCDHHYNRFTYALLLIWKLKNVIK